MGSGFIKNSSGPMAKYGNSFFWSENLGGGRRELGGQREIPGCSWMLPELENLAVKRGIYDPHLLHQKIYGHFPCNDFKAQNKIGRVFPSPFSLSLCLSVYPSAFILFFFSLASMTLALFKYPCLVGASSVSGEETPLGPVLTRALLPHTVNNLPPSSAHKSLRIFGVNSNCSVSPRGRAEGGCMCVCAFHLIFLSLVKSTFCSTHHF